MATLQLSLGTDQVNTFELEGDTITIGRSKSCTITVIEEALSRHHASIRRIKDGFVLVDNASSNGCFVNGEKVFDHKLEHGDKIRLGSIVFVFSDPPDSRSTALLDRNELARLAAQERSRPQVAADPVALPVAAAVAPQAPPPPVIPVAPPAAVVAPPSPVKPAAPVVAPQAPPPLPSFQPPAMRPAIGGAVNSLPAPSMDGGVTYAGFGIRLLAYILDGLLLGLVLSIIQAPAVLLATSLGQRNQALAITIAIFGWLLVMAAGIGWVLFFWATRGATPAKKLFGLKIIREDGIEPMGWAKAGLRMLGYMASGFILYIGFIMIFFTDRKRGLHDMIAGTVVVKTENTR